MRYALLLATCSLLLSPLTADASFHKAQFEAAESGAGVSEEKVSIVVVVARIIRAAFSLVGIVFIIILVRGGFTYMTSGGESDKVEEAKKYIKNGIIGVALVLMAFAISKFVIDAALNAIGNTPCKGFFSLYGCG